MFKKEAIFMRQFSIIIHLLDLLKLITLENLVFL